MPRNKAIAELDEGLEEARLEVIRDAVSNASNTLAVHLKREFGCGNDTLTELGERDLDLALHNAAEEWFSMHHPGFLTVQGVAASLKAWLPSGLAGQVKLDDRDELEPRLYLHIGDGISGDRPFWEVRYPFKAPEEGWYIELRSPGQESGYEIPLNYGILTPNTKAKIVARDILDTIGWPRYPMSREETANAPANVERVVQEPRSLVISGHINLFNSVGQ